MVSSGTLLRADAPAITGGPNTTKDGVPGTQEDRRIDHIIPKEAVQRGRYECIIEVSVNALFGLGLDGYRHQQPDVGPRHSSRLIADECIFPVGIGGHCRGQIASTTIADRLSGPHPIDPDAERCGLENLA